MRTFNIFADDNIFLGIISVFIGGTILYLKIKKKWIYKNNEDKTFYDFILSLQGWFGAIGLFLCGITIIIKEFIKWIK